MAPNPKIKKIKAFKLRLIRMVKVKITVISSQLDKSGLKMNIGDVMMELKIIVYLVYIFLNTYLRSQCNPNSKKLR